MAGNHFEIISGATRSALALVINAKNVIVTSTNTIKLFCRPEFYQREF